MRFYLEANKRLQKNPLSILSLRMQILKASEYKATEYKANEETGIVSNHQVAKNSQ